jgi:hypothetical protein
MKKLLETKERDDGICDKFEFEPNGPPVWIKREEDWKQALRMPVSCRACGALHMNIDTSSFFRYGVCKQCEVFYLEGRDISNLKTNEERVEFCKAGIAEKMNRKRE